MTRANRESLNFKRLPFDCSVPGNGRGNEKSRRIDGEVYTEVLLRRGACPGAASGGQTRSAEGEETRQRQS